MLMCPAMFYGSPEPGDMDFNLFAILYKSIFKQGFCRPAGDGIRGLLELLKKRYVESGGELTLNCGVASVHEENGRAARLVTDKGEEIVFDNILSSAGLCETMALLDGGAPAPEPGKMSFAESIAVMRESFDDNSGGAAIIFYSDSDDFEHKIPASAADCSSGIICMPSNFKFRPGDKVPEKSVRVSAKANADVWLDAPEDEYKRMKDSVSREMFASAQKTLGCADIAANAVAVDVMTPRTIKRFTGHCNGAIYGSPVKLRDGRTRLENLYVCGTDQGFLGITGAMFSGITVANLYLLK